MIDDIREDAESRMKKSLETLQGGDHAVAIRQVGTGLVGTVFPEAGEPHDDGTGCNPEDDLGHDDHNVIAKTQATAAVTAHETVHGIAHYPSGKDDKGVHYPLDQAQGHHVAVGHMADFMSQYRSGLFRAKPLQQSL